MDIPVVSSRLVDINASHDVLLVAAVRNVQDAREERVPMP